MIDIPISACSIFDCGTCVHRIKHRCPGCTQGNALLLAQAESQCDIYACTLSHSILTCTDCTEPNCQFTRSLAMVCPIRANYEKKRTYTRQMSDHFDNLAPDRHDTALVTRKLDKAIERLARYLFAVREFQSYGVIHISSEDISRKIGVKSWLVRRDLSHFGEFGRPSIGYVTNQLRERLEEILHLNTPNRIVWIGADRLEADQSLIQRFLEHNYHVVGVFDIDVSNTPKIISGHKVLPIAELPGAIKELGVQGAILATSCENAQRVADTLVSSGIKGILNLTSTLISIPSDICVRNVDIVAELFTLSYYCGRLHNVTVE